MKKLLCLAFAVVCLSACGGKETKTMTCTLNAKENGMITDSKIDIKYQGEEVISQGQSLSITAETDEIYNIMQPILAEASKSLNYKDMEGVTYEFKDEKDSKKVTEKITIDLTKISSADYKKITKSTIDIEKTKIGVDETKEKFEKQKFTCKK